MAFEHPVTQGSEAWLRLRLGIPTASEFDNLVSPTGKARDGQMPQTYLYSKVAENLVGAPIDRGGSWYMDQGALAESEAVPYYEFTYGTPVRRIGFVTTDDHKIGCSPDGLIGSDGGLEVKCPMPATHIKYLIEGGVPKEYAVQVQGSMFVTGRPWWTFMSYCRNLPALVVKVERSPVFQAALETALTDFTGKLSAALTSIEAMRGPKKSASRKVSR